MTTPEDDARLGALLREALEENVADVVYDVSVVRWMDGNRILHDHRGLSALEVLALRREEEGLVGELVVFDVVPRAYGGAVAVASRPRTRKDPRLRTEGPLPDRTTGRFDLSTVPAASDRTHAQERAISLELTRRLTQAVDLRVRYWPPPEDEDEFSDWLEELFVDVRVALHIVTTEGSPYPTKPERKPISWRVRKAVFERDEYRCVRCGGFLDLEVDHVVPVVLGGEDSIENYQTLCGEHNRKKGARRE